MTLEVSRDIPLQTTDTLARLRNDNDERRGADPVAATLTGSAAGRMGVLCPNRQLPLRTC